MNAPKADEGMNKYKKKTLFPILCQFDKVWWHVLIEPLIEIPSVKHFFVLENMGRDSLNIEILTLCGGRC